MGKNHHHLKKVKSERGKTKLRVKTEKTKFLPKGLNVTKTDFKVKAIIVPQQLREHGENEILSKRKLNLKDILSRLRHHNTNVKHDCCEELKQLLNVHTEELLGHHLSQVLHGVSPLLLDREKKVRRAAILIFNNIFELVSIDNIKPFFALLSSYLRCSMTDIDRSVQEDSLLFLDGLLKHVPSLVAADGEKILPNLFSLISKMKTDSQPGRTLTMNLGSKVTIVKWRVQVLIRLHGFLKAFIEHQNNEKVFMQEGVFKFANETNLVPLIHNPYVNKVDTINFLTVIQEMEDTDVITMNFKTLMSLLNEVWMEVAPQKDNKNSNEGTLLDTEAGAVLTCILYLLHLLLQYKTVDENSNLNDFFTTDCQNFLNNVMKLYPFSQNIGSKKDAAGIQKLLQINVDPKCSKENLLIAYLYCLSHKVIRGKGNQEKAKRILNYVNDCLSKKNQSDATYILPIANTLLLRNYLYWEKEDLNMPEFLNRVIEYIGKSATAPKSQNGAFQLLSKILQLPHLNKCQSYQQWLGSLPSLLCNKEISAVVLDVLLLIAKQNNPTFISTLIERTSDILDNYDQIKVTSTDHPEMIKEKILHIFYFIPTLTKKQRTLFENFNRKHGNSIPCIQYILSK